ncbi:unnamed protein product, partial [Closterium sp. NIES-54]
EQPSRPAAEPPSRPAAEPPLEQLPLQQPPLEQPPLQQPPLEQPPLQQPPPEKPPLQQPPPEQPPLQQPPLEQPPLIAACSGQVHLQRRPRAVLSPQQLREWYAQRDGSRGTARCPYVIRTGARTGQPRGTLGHAESRCFARLSDAWCTEFGDAAELPDWVELLRLRVDIYTLDYDAILTAMYALPTSDEGDCYLCVPPSPSIEAAALGAGEAAALGACASAASGTGESALLGTASAQVFHTFTLDSGASRSFFRDRTTLTLLSRPVVVSLADPSRGPVLASFSTVLPCPAAPSGTLSGLYLPSFSTNLVSGADLQDQGVDQFTPASQRVTRCTCARTGRHLATFTRRSGSSLYTLSTESPPVPASSQVFAAASESGPESAPCLGRLLSHQTLLWHHRLVHPSLPRLRGMASRVLVSGLPRSLPPLPPGPAPTCVPCVEGRQRPHSPPRDSGKLRPLRPSPSGASVPSLPGPLWSLFLCPPELRWLTYLLTNLGELPRSPPVLYVKNKSMLVLCREHRLEHRTKHIALRYFLARELQQRGQLRLAYVAFEANTADIFTKALPPGDHQRFCTMLGFPTFLYVNNKAMLALCWEHRLEHRTKHIALRYFLARELQQRGQLRLAYVASQANTADIFTKALQPCDHQRFCTMLGLVPTWPHLLTS